ncbi:MAG: phenylacetate--CoA ligase, partial [Chloroflexi bacterium]|nr:phenylacetate--CoA ligase [Chloroflexota bacterium]
MGTKKTALSIEVLEKMSAGERRKYLDGRLKELIAYAYKKAPAIKARFDKAGISPTAVSGIKDLEKLPILRKDELIDLYKNNPPLAGLVTVPLEDLERVYVSPGPIYDPHHQSESFWQRHVQLVRAMGFGKRDVV